MYNQFPCCPYYMNQANSPYLNGRWRNNTQNFAAVSGIVTRIEDYYPGQTDELGSCYKLMSLESKDRGPINFVISPETYFVNHEVVAVGDEVTGFYDANAPVILIYPPQYPAIVIAKNTKYQNVTVDYFDNQLISSDGNMSLNCLYQS